MAVVPNSFTAVTSATGKQLDDNFTACAGNAELAAPSGSSLVGFQPAGAGAIARTQQDKNRDIVNAADFGVTCDGVTNDTTAFNLAVTFANTLINGRKKTLVVNPGVCLLTPGSTTPVTCNIDAPRTSFVAASNVNANLLTIGYDGSYKEFQRVRILELTGFGFNYGFTDTRYGTGIGFSAADGQYIGQFDIDVGYVQGFIYGFNGKCNFPTTGFHIGTGRVNINTLWYCGTGIYSIPGNLQFENVAFEILYMTGCNTNISCGTGGTAGNAQNNYHVNCMELHNIVNTIGVLFAGSHTYANIVTVDSLYYNANTQWIVSTDSLPFSNVYNLPDADTSKLSIGADVLNVKGTGLFSQPTNTRSVIYSATTFPASGTWRVGDRCIINNPTAGSPSSFVYTAAGWTPETVAGSGTYTPTRTLGSNAASCTPYLVGYSRTGNFVTVSVRLDIAATSANVQTKVSITLPIASLLALQGDLTGTISSSSAGLEWIGSITPDTTNHIAVIAFQPPTTAATGYFGSFTYQVK